MTRTLLLLPALSLIACGGDDAAKDSGTETESCTITVTTTPAPNSDEAYYRGNIEFRLSAPDETATITTDIPGTKIVSADGKTISWDPTDALAPNTAYSATLNYCGGDVELNFTTSALGTAVADAASLEGNVYGLALADARIVEPAGVGAVLSTVLTQVILVGVDSVGTDSIAMIGAVAKDRATTQDFCNPSIPFPAADFANPYFELPQQDLTLNVMDQSITIQALEITGTFADDGSAFGGGTLRGNIDTRPFAALVNPENPTDSAVCDFAAGLLIECEPCADGQPYCLTIVADQITAEKTGGPALVPLNEECDATACVNYTADSFTGVTAGECPA
jgi:hypothetical protein